jgi:hypothetical protein
MDEKLKNAIINTFRKVREDPVLMSFSSRRILVNDKVPVKPKYSHQMRYTSKYITPSNYIAGLFINYYYREVQIHNGLDTSMFFVSFNGTIPTIEICKDPKSNNEHIQRLITELPKLSDSDFYHLWLSSSFLGDNYYGVDSEDQKIANNVLNVKSYIENLIKNGTETKSPV